MIDWYPILKLIHIVSATILFGTGIGIALFSLWSHLSNDIRIIAYTFKKTVIADLIFTTPAVIIQPISGLLLVYYQGYDLFETWLSIAYIQIRNIANFTLNKKLQKLPDQYYKYFYIWFILGWPAFLSLIVIFILMIYKPIL